MSKKQLRFCLKGSALALAVMLAQTASAQCAPDSQDPNISYCTSVDSDGYEVGHAGKQVFVMPDALVQRGTGQAALTTRMENGSITVDGRIDGQGGVGLLLFNADPYEILCDRSNFVQLGCGLGSVVVNRPSSRSTVTIGADGVISGSNGIVLQRSPDNPYRPITFTITNAGQILGTDGAAIRIDLPQFVDGGAGPVQVSNLVRLVNVAGGYIGGIEGTGFEITNVGTVYGSGTRSAVNQLNAIITNSNGGVFGSDGATTITVSNELTLTNQAGGIIRNALGGNAIEVGGALTLTNDGTIIGSIVSTAAAGQNSLVDLSTGMVEGNLQLGAGNDTLRLRFDAAHGTFAGITGSVDGGGGFDTVSFNVDEDGVLGAFGSSLPTNFERFGFNMVDGATLRLAETMLVTSGVELTGAGTLVNGGRFVTTGTALVAQPNSNTQPTDDPFVPPRNAPIIFENDGSVYANLADTADYAIDRPNELINRGVITAVGGNGVQVVDSLVNTGTIEASGTAASISYGRFDNSGTIRSTDGVGLALISSPNLAMSNNSGTIRGTSVGLQIQGQAENDGIIDGGLVGVGLNGLFSNAAGAVVTGTTASVSGVGTVVNAGTLQGDVLLGVGTSLSGSFTDDGGVVNGAILMGDGDDELITDLFQPDGRALAGALGGVDAGGGIDRISYRVTADASMTLARPDSFEALGFLLSNGAVLSLSDTAVLDTTLILGGVGSVDLHADISVENAPAIQIADTSQLLSVTSYGRLATIGSVPPSTAVVSGYLQRFVNQGQIIAAVGGDGISGADRFDNGGLVQVNGGTAVVGVGAIVNDGTITDLAGDGSSGIVGFVSLQNDGVIRVDQTAIANQAFSPGRLASVTNSGIIESRLGDAIDLINANASNLTDGVIIGNVRGNNLAFDNAGHIAGNVSIYGTGGILRNQGSIDGHVSLADYYARFDNAGLLDGDVVGDANTAILNNSGVITGNIAMTGEATGLTNSGSIQGNVDLAQGVAQVSLTGTIAGDLIFGAQDDRLILAGNWAIGGSVQGGDGRDLLDLTVDGTEAAPSLVDLARFSGFEQFDMQGGHARVGNMTFDLINVWNGSLTGGAGSTINGDIYIGTDARFGSAGTVNGDIMVAGTLAPGASPGTMTVNGDVNLAPHSTLLMEFSPTVSDALVINGALAISAEANLVMTGERPATPGIYEMIVATGGITGSFGSNVTKDGRIIGVLSYAEDSIRLISMFQFRTDPTAQVQRTADYLNSLLVDGTATAGVIAGFPQLLGADGYANPAALATLSPEPYASVAQMGIENGLAIADAVRDLQLAGLGDEGGLFVFGQAYGHWRTFDADDRGVAAAGIDSNGYLGGVGYGNNTVGAAIFVGRSDSRQNMRSIAARNDADGLFFGGRLHYRAGGLSAGLSLIFDRATADTSRNPVGGVGARSHYDLHGTTVDGWLGYGLDVGDSWQLGPRLGITHVRVSRAAISEDGGGAFALNVAKQKYDATFLTADLRIEAVAAAVRPWASAGIRSRIDGDPITATAAFAGVGERYSVDGVRRKKTLPHVAAGMALGLSDNLSLHFDGDAEFSGSNAAQQANIGVMLRF